jgi:hypothetical protein
MKNPILMIMEILLIVIMKIEKKMGNGLHIQNLGSEKNISMK